MSTASEKWAAMEPRERDAAVGEAIGWEPTVEWMASDDHGKSLMASTLDRDCWPTKFHLEVWLASRRKEAPERFASTEIVEWKRWPRFTTDASDDYLVLQKVRETWTGEPVETFCDALFWIIQHEDRQTRHGSTLMDPDWVRKSSWIAWYEPGDYSHAAYLAINQ